jgi:hypothetical protein
MTALPSADIIRLRFLIGFLGEEAQAGWWPSRFLGPSSAAFLKPVFARTTLLAQYHGVREAARRVHDERIGIGRVFHLFRLPESTERRLFEELQQTDSPENLKPTLASRTTAMAELQKLGKAPPAPHHGPLQAGTATDLTGASWLPKLASIYRAAFENDVQSFPYFLGTP